MAASDSVFAGSIVALYDEVLGPFMFEPMAQAAAMRFAGFTGAMLEIAAGTGAVTRALDQVLAPEATVVASDLNPPMLDRAAARLTSRRVRFTPADALALPFENAAFDAAICQFGVMFYPDQAAGHREARRVLRPGGRYVFTLWDRLEANPVADCVDRTMAALFPEDPPGFLRRTPHGHHDPARHRQALSAAGFADIEVETLSLTSGPADAGALAVGFCQGTPLRAEIEQRDAEGLSRATQALEAALRAEFGAGRFEAPIQALLITTSRAA